MEFELNEKLKLSIFIEIFKFIKNLSDYVSFSCNLDGIQIQVMDSSHVSLLDLALQANWFGTYICETPIIFSLCNNDFIKILKTVPAKGNYLKCLVDDEHFHIQFKQKDHDKHFQLNIMDIEQEIMCCEEYESDLDFKISIPILDDHMGSIFGEDIEIKCKDDLLYLISYDDKNQKTDITLKTECLEEFNVVDDYDASFKFCAKYMMFISKLKKIDHIHIYLNEGKPVFFHVTEEGFNFRYYVALKSDEDD